MLRLVSLLLASACSGDQSIPLRPPPGAPTGAIEVHLPDRLTGLATGKTDALGRPLRVACASCHSLRRPTALPTNMKELDEFHQGLTFRHGELSCASCHSIGDQSTLHRADGTDVPMREAMQLCRQCHGPQARDYDHGAHGGMTGYWDLSAGGRVRNNCIDCHDPHLPAFQPSRPVLKPRTRGDAP